MSSFEWMELQTLISDIATARSRLADARQRKDHGRIRALEDEISKAERLRLQLVAHITTNIVSEDPGPASKRKGRDGGAAAAPAAPAEPEPDNKQPEPASAAAAEPAASAPADEPVSAAEPATADEPEPAAEPAPVDEPAIEAAGDAAAEPAPEPEPAPPPEPEPPAAADAADGAAPEPALESSATDLPEEVNGREQIPEPADRIVARGPAPLASGPKAVSAEGGFIVWDQLTPDHIERAKRELATRRAEMLSRHAEELKALEVEQIQLDGLEQAIQSFLQKFSKSDEAAVVQLEQGRGSRQ
jgi:hypothetical protein